MNALSDTVSKWQIREKLESFPVTLDQMYLETVSRIENQTSASAELACRVLIWVSCAVRPLTVRELQTAVALEPGLMEMNVERLSDEQTLTSVCGGLLTIEPRTNFVRLIHYTAQGYLERLCDTKWPTAKLKIAELLLNYLCFRGLDIPLSQRVMEDFSTFTDWCTEMHNRYPLLRYAATNLGGHINCRGDIEQDLAASVLTFAENRKRNYNILLFNGLMFYHFNHENAIFEASALHLYGAIGLKTTIHTYLTQDRSDLNSIWPIGVTPLALAVAQGHYQSASLLLDFGASMTNEPYPVKWVITQKHARLTYVVHLLHIAAMLNHTSLIDLLVKRGGVVDTWVYHTGTALHGAVRAGHLDAVQLLLRNGAKLNGFAYSALHTAAIGRNDEIFKVLLDHGVDVNERDSSGSTALFSTVGAGCYHMSHLLLEQGVDVNLVNDEGETALFKIITLCMLPGTARADPLLLLQDLISHSANLNFQDKQGWTILNHALRHIQEANGAPEMPNIILYLLKNGANLMLKDGKGMTLVHHAANYGEVTFLVMALQCAAIADINSKDVRGYTPLHHAVRSGRVVCVDWLLRNGADAGAYDNDGRVALHYAIASETDDVRTLIEKLIGMGANINALDCNGQTPLHIAANQGWWRIDQLIAYGAELNLQDKFGYSPLIYAVYRGNEKLVAILQARNADVNTRINRGHTAIHFAANQGDVVILDALVRNGADLQARDSEGFTALLYGARHAAITKYLLEHGLGPAADVAHYTSLHRAAFYGNMEAITMLLQHGADPRMDEEAWQYGLGCVANSKLFDITGYVPQSYEQTVQMISTCVTEVGEHYGMDFSQALPLRER